MSVRRSVRMLSAMLVAGAALVALSPAQVQARAMAPGDCPVGRVCGWSSSVYVGSMAVLPTGSGCHNAPFQVRSVVNNTNSPGGLTALLYSGSNCTGRFLMSVGPQRRYPTLPEPALSVFINW
ncbi:peptidase inhibitor family I36 protein [Sphaerisporangium sp. B11E5]|uniref:peptidase inhibitor family I36 protein n=1 Tax=Sphaerisporangium sp. B11E5 TaxID=3153563 RepID=UPI00325E3E3E